MCKIILCSLGKPTRLFIEFALQFCRKQFCERKPIVKFRVQ